MKYFLMALALIPIISFAHSGRTDSSGGHNCRVGSCAGTYHSHNGGYTKTPSYSAPAYTPSFNTPSTPSYSYSSIPSQPSCPLFSSYSYLSESCKCNAGYVASSGFSGASKCVSAYSYCSGKYGFNAQYNSIKDSCECSSGYLLSDGRCQSAESLCKDEYGFGAEHVAGTDSSCSCSDGYSWDSSGTSCEYKVEKEEPATTSASGGSMAQFCVSTYLDQTTINYYLRFFDDEIEERIIPNVYRKKFQKYADCLDT